MLLFLSMLETEEERALCEELYCNYRSDMYRLAYSFVKNQYDAEDIVQTVFCKAAEKYMGRLTGFEEAARKRFLLLVTRHRALSLLRKNAHVVSLDAALEDGAHLPELTEADFVESICRTAEYEELEKAIEKLDSDAKDVLWLRFRLELTTAEICEILNEKPATVTKRLQRAKNRLAQMLAPKGGAA